MLLTRLFYGFKNALNCFHFVILIFAAILNVTNIEPPKSVLVKDNLDKAVSLGKRLLIVRFFLVAKYST
jgi:hypothetical protein